MTEHGAEQAIAGLGGLKRKSHGADVENPNEVTTEDEFEAGVAASALVVSSSTLVGTATTVQGVFEELDNGVNLDNQVQVCPASASNAIALDASLGHVVTLTTTESTTITISNLTAGQSLTIIVTAGGAHTVVFASTFFAGGTEPTQTSSGVDIYTIIKVGTQLYGFVAGQDMKT